MIDMKGFLKEITKCEDVEKKELLYTALLADTLKSEILLLDGTIDLMIETNKPQILIDRLVDVLVDKKRMLNEIAEFTEENY